MNRYTTGEIAKTIGIHPNTVRLYEDLGLITKPERLPNGYRLFTDEHLLQFRLARTAFEVEVLQSGLRKEVVEIIKTAAAREYAAAMRMTKTYLTHILREQENAEEAITIARQILAGTSQAGDGEVMTRQQTANLLDITIDTLRNWELNGLLTVKRKRNGYRVYDAEDVQTLKLIRTLRCANYSLSSILRMLNVLKRVPVADIRAIIDTPEKSEPIVSVYDRLLTSLQHAEQNAWKIIALLAERNNSKTNPPL